MDARVAFMMLHNRGQKSVSAAMQGFDVTRRIGRIAKGVAELGHGLVEAAIEVHKGMRWPKLLAEFFSRDELAWTLQQEYEDFEWLLLKLDPKSVLAQFTGAQISFENPKPQSPRRTLSGLHADTLNLTPTGSLHLRESLAQPLTGFKTRHAYGSSLRSKDASI